MLTPLALDRPIGSASLEEPRGPLGAGAVCRGVPQPMPPTAAGSADPTTYELTATDQDRYRLIVAQHFDAVWRTLRGLGVPAASVDDAAQQVFLVALRKLAAIAPGSERSFLLGTAVGIASNARRSIARAREVANPDALLARVDPQPDPEQAALLSERRAIVQQILDGMPDDLRTVFVLFELEGLTSIEIGRMLDIPVGTASSRLRRAREHFQAHVNRRLAPPHGRGAR